jgi:hypothetical protein
LFVLFFCISLWFVWTKDKSRNERKKRKREEYEKWKATVLSTKGLSRLCHKNKYEQTEWNKKIAIFLRLWYCSHCSKKIKTNNTRKLSQSRENKRNLSQSMIDKNAKNFALTL